MSDLNLYPLDLEELYLFLLAQPMNAVVGMACSDGDCPLARFLNAQYPGSSFVVNVAEYRRLMDDISLGAECCAADVVSPLPAWAQDFVHLVDASSDFWEDVPVTAFDALAFLCAACTACGVPLGVQHG